MSTVASVMGDLPPNGDAIDVVERFNADEFSSGLAATSIPGALQDVVEGTGDEAYAMALRELSFQFEESSCETLSRSAESLSCTLPARSAGKTAWVVSAFGSSVVFDPVFGLKGLTYSAEKTPRVDTIMIASTAPIPAARPTNIQAKAVSPKLSSIEISWTPGAANECKL